MNATTSERLRTALLTLAGVAGLATLAATTAEAGPGFVSPYVVQADGYQDVVFGESVQIHRPGNGQPAFVSVDGNPVLQSGGLVSITTENGGDQQQQVYGDTTTTELPGGGVRVDIDHGDGSSTTIVHDPNGGTNGGSRSTVGHTSSDGTTTTTTTTTDGNDGSSTTTTSQNK